jgi:uncharacterized Zn finger protein
MSWSYEWRPYVPVAQRRAQAARHAARLAKNGHTVKPVRITGRDMAKTFWGRAWCDNLERYSDFANRLPRGRTYARNGSIVDLQITKGKITAVVSGSEIYDIKINIQPLRLPQWKKLKQACSQSIASLMDLMQGRFSDGVMERLTRKDDGLFPAPAEIKIACSCPDWAYLCKHAAAVMYGIGARLDEEPELLFTLRDVDQLELISQAIASDNLAQALGTDQVAALAGEDLGEMFGIELDTSVAPAPQPSGKKPSRRGWKLPAQPAEKKMPAKAVASAVRESVAKSQARAVARKKQPAAKRAKPLR